MISEGPINTEFAAFLKEGDAEITRLLTPQEREDYGLRNK